MPKIKISHILSFSSEDPVHVARNILNSDATKKWKCQTAGEKTSTVVLQLEKASVIKGIDIGNEHSAYVEVLVNRSSNPNDFQPLLVMSTLMTAPESRQSININKVRMFKYEDFNEAVRGEKWDCIKIVCTQPHNRHVQYGLSFVNIHTADDIEEAASSQSFGKFTLRPPSPDVIVPGSLFSKRNELSQSESTTEVKECGSPQTLSKTKLKESLAAIAKNRTPIKNSPGSSKPRNRDDLLYCKDEEEPNEKIDKIVEQKRGEDEKKRKEEEEIKLKNKNKIKTLKNSPSTPESNKIKEKESESSSTSSLRKEEDKIKTTAVTNRISSISPTASTSESNKRKEKEGENPSSSKKMKLDRPGKPFNRLLSGVVFVISGIQNPERADIRSNGIAMGAKYKPDWDPSCTHLVCAFVNTPKFNLVKGKGKIVNKYWIKECYRERKRFPWRRFALDRNDKAEDESEEEICEEVAVASTSEINKIVDVSDDNSEKSSDSDALNTDDEIARIVVQKENENDVFQVDTDEEDVFNARRLDLFANKVFYISEELNGQSDKLSRYIKACRGILVDEPGDVVDMIITSTSSEYLKEVCPDAELVKPDWIIECSKSEKLLPINEYTV